MAALARYLRSLAVLRQPPLALGLGRLELGLPLRAAKAKRTKAEVEVHEDMHEPLTDSKRVAQTTLRD